MASPGADVGNPDCAPWLSSGFVSEKNECVSGKLASAGSVVSSGGKEVSIDGSAGTDGSRGGKDESIAGNDESMGGIVLSIAGKVESIAGSAGMDDSLAAGALVVSLAVSVGGTFCDSVDGLADSPGGLADSVDSVISNDYPISDENPGSRVNFFLRIREVRRSLIGRAVVKEFFFFFFFPRDFVLVD